MHQVILGNSLEAISQMDEGIFDLALIDPPYFDYKTGHRKDKKGKLSQSLVQQPREEQIETIHQCIRVLKEDRAFFVFTNWENIWWIQQRFEGIFRNMIIWDKGNWSAGDLKGSFGNKYEVIFLGVKGKWKYKGKREHDIWSIPRVGTDRTHSTEKPVALYRKCIENSTDEGAMILDPYLGSAASAVAALSLNRNFLGYEIDEEYYRRAIKRIEEFKNDLEKR